METWKILLIIVAVALVIVWFLTRKKTVNESIIPRALVSKTSVAPGVIPETGEVPPAPPPPPPPNTTVSPHVALTRAVSQAVKLSANPTAALTHVPVVGAVVAPVRAVSSAANRVTFGVTDKVNNTLEHVPLVGSTLAAPGKAISSAAKSVTAVFGF